MLARYRQEFARMARRALGLIAWIGIRDRYITEQMRVAGIAGRITAAVIRIVSTGVAIGTNQ